MTNSDTNENGNFLEKRTCSHHYQTKFDFFECHRCILPPQCPLFSHRHFKYHEIGRQTRLHYLLSLRIGAFNSYVHRGSRHARKFGPYRRIGKSRECSKQNSPENNGAISFAHDNHANSDLIHTGKFHDNYSHFVCDFPDS